MCMSPYVLVLVLFHRAAALFCMSATTHGSWEPAACVPRRHAPAEKVVVVSEFLLVHVCGSSARPVDCCLGPVQTLTDTTVVLRAVVV